MGNSQPIQVTRRRFLQTAAALAGASFAAPALAGCDAVLSQTPEEYLEQHATVLDLDGSLDPNALGAMEKYQVILAGELHNRAKAYQARRMLNEYFFEQCDGRYILYEAGFGATLILDRYINGGDKADLEFFAEQIEGTLGCTQEYFDYLHWLRDYNEGQSEGRRAHLIGIDIDHQVELWVRGLSTLLSEGASVPSELAPLVEAIKADDADIAFDELNKALEEIPEALRELFGGGHGIFSDSLELLKQLVKTREQARTFYALSRIEQNSTALRDEAMADTFHFVYGLYPDERYFGQLGGAHILLAAGEEGSGITDMTGNRTFAMEISAEGQPLHGKVCAIESQYVTKLPWNKGLKPQDLTASDEERFDYELLQPWAGKDVLFDLDAPGSPFAKDVCLIKQPADPGAVTTDFFQKLLLLTDSEETTQYVG